jgi:hypothetical protein
MDKKIDVIADGTNRLVFIFPEGSNLGSFKTKVSVDAVAEMLKSSGNDVEGQNCIQYALCDVLKVLEKKCGG